MGTHARSRSGDRRRRSSRSNRFLELLARISPLTRPEQPSRIGRRREEPPNHDIASLKSSFRISDSIRILKKRRWSLFDLQYVLLAFFILGSLYIAPSAPVLKTVVIALAVALLLVPATSQFLLPSLPIWCYLLYFFCSRFIPTAYRPSISVVVLPALEDILYGANLSKIFSAYTHPALDLLAWFPYGIGHFGGPAVCSVLLFLFAAPGTTPLFAKTFGWISIIGVTIQIIFPCTPPWYQNDHGLEPAAYGMPGSAAGLSRIDKIFGVDMYTTNFATAPVPFGAFPSLHAADAVIEALFVSHCFPRLRAFSIFYVCWIWWATMYLAHHYAVDLVAGAMLAGGAFWIVSKHWLPRAQLDKLTRWEYEHVETGREKIADEEKQEAPTLLDLKLLHGRSSSSSDEWAASNSSGYLSSTESRRGSSIFDEGPVCETESAAPRSSVGSSSRHWTKSPGGLDHRLD